MMTHRTLGLITPADQTAIEAAAAGSTTNEQYVKTLYALAFERQPTADQLAHQLANLANGMTRAVLAQNIALNAEAQNPEPTPATQQQPAQTQQQAPQQQTATGGIEPKPAAAWYSSPAVLLMAGLALVYVGTRQ